MTDEPKTESRPGRGGMKDDMAESVDINGLRACPDCGRLGEVRVQTPPDDDGIVRRCYFRCFNCHWVSPNYPDWKPVHWRGSGSVRFPPLLEFYNNLTG